MIFIYGDSFKNHIVAIVVPEPSTLEPFCVDHNIDGSSMTAIANHNQVFKLIQEDLQRLATENRLNSLEQVRDHFRIVDKIFEVGYVLTPTMKLRRPFAREMYQDLINDMYAETDNLMNA